MDDMTWTPPRLLTFYARMRLTYLLFWLRLPMPVVWLTALWSSGATVSFLLIDRQRASLNIESGNGLKTVDVTVAKKAVAAM